jgi:hypothetical protein
MTVLRSPIAGAPMAALSCSTAVSLCHAFVTFVRRPTSSPLSILCVAIKNGPADWLCRKMTNSDRHRSKCCPAGRAPGTGGRRSHAVFCASRVLPFGRHETLSATLGSTNAKPNTSHEVTAAAQGSCPTGQFLLKPQVLLSCFGGAGQVIHGDNADLLALHGLHTEAVAFGALVFKCAAGLV